MVGDLALARGTMMPSECIENRKGFDEKGGCDMLLEIVGAVATVITVFSAGIAVGRYIE